MADQLTQGGLQRAKIINLTTNEEVQCMFNPKEYTLTKQNSWKADEGRIGRNTPNVKFERGGAQSLKLTLYFDSLYDNADVRFYTDALWKMMMVDEQNSDSESEKGAPPHVAFSWGKLYFRAVLKSMTQKFTLFKADGTPVRCTVDITLDQMVDTEDYKDGDSYRPATINSRFHEVTATGADRADHLVPANSRSTADRAAETRAMLEANDIDNPQSITPGTALRVNRR